MDKIIDNLYFEASIQDKLAVISLKAEAFELITSIADSQVMMDFINSRRTHLWKIKMFRPFCKKIPASDKSTY
jgi:hypothetical protein